MKQLKKTILTLVALLALTAQAWADGVKIKFAANGKEKVVTVESLPHTFWCNNDNASDELDLILQELYDWPNDNGDNYYCYIYDPYPSASGNDKVTAGIDGINHYVTIAEGFEGSATVTGKYQIVGGVATYELAISPAAPAGPEVAWTAATKTGTFTMPGGNVTLEPEYYTQAALTAAPTAINDVPATTDGAIVKAGTVKNIGETTTAQGTVMYYVSTTALDDAALLALAADQWTADVPTAAHLTEGEAYVYYYVRGNNGDTDETTFSDGDILAANALTVTIAAAPTYAVTFAEGTDPNEWKADPATGVTKGQTVTVTYTGTKKVLGVKAEKKAAAPAGPVTYTELKGGEVLHVGDKIQVPETDKYWFPGGATLDYRYTYEVVRVNISGSSYETTATESETGAYYALHEVGSNNYLFATATIDDSSRLPATATSDGIAVADNGFTNGYHKYIFSVHEK